MPQVTISSTYQVSIPEQLREQMNIKVGQKFVLIPDGKHIHFRAQLSIDDVKGMLAGANTKNFRSNLS